MLLNCFYVLVVCCCFIRSVCVDALTQSTCEGPDQTALLQERIKTDFANTGHADKNKRLDTKFDKPYNMITAQHGAPQILNARPSANHSNVAPWGKALDVKTAPCNCVESDPSWKPCARTTPRCVFIDLGAADGNTFQSFLSDSFGPVANCPNGEWSAVLVEANPRFDSQLLALGKKHYNVNALASTAAYMCEATTSFFLDTVSKAENYWGSSMSASNAAGNAHFLSSVEKTKVTVPTMNLNKIIFEQTIPGDWVMLKMDIEGSEYDVLPCLAKASASSLIDRLYLEQHDWLDDWGLIGTTAKEMEDAKTTLRKKGVDIPHYYSPTF